MRLLYSAATLLQKKKIYWHLNSFLPSPLIERYRSSCDGWKESNSLLISWEDPTRGKPLQVNAYLTGNAQKLLFNTDHDSMLTALKNKSTLFFFFIYWLKSLEATADLLVSAKNSKELSVVFYLNLSVTENCISKSVLSYHIWTLK